MENNPLKWNPRTLEQSVEQLLAVAKRNSAIAEMLRFKEYRPSWQLKEYYKRKYPECPLKWYHLPGRGRYCNLELKFHTDWNWLVSVLIEMKKYYASHDHQYHTVAETKQDRIYHIIKSITPFDFDMKIIWQLVSDYALALQEQKQIDALKVSVMIGKKGM